MSMRKELEYVVTENGCHICTSHTKNKKGYPYFTRNGKYQSVHRFLFKEKYGYSPEVVEHICNNPSCINIDHLKAGTHKSNNQYKAQCGRTHGQKLKPDQVKAIRKDQRKQKEIAEDYGVTQQTISDIKVGRRWGHLK